MGVTVGQVHQSDNYSSGLRYSLLEIEPIEEKKIVKRFGLRFVERTRGFRPSTSFPDFIRFNTAATLECIYLSDTVDREALTEVIVKRRIERFESDKEFKKEIHALEKAREKARGSNTLKKFVAFLVERQRAETDSIFKGYASFFLSSDLPLSFFSELTDFEATYAASLEMILFLVNRFTTLMNLPRARSEFRIYERQFRQMKYALAPIIEQLEEAVFRTQALKWYIIFSNTEDVETAFEPHEISRSKLKSEEFDRLRFESREASLRFRKMVMEFDVRMFKPLLREEDDFRSAFDEMAMTVIG